MRSNGQSTREVTTVSSENGGVGDGQQPHDVALTVLGVIGSCLTILLLLAVFAPQEIGALFEPLTNLFARSAFGFTVWQLVTIAILAAGSWLLVVDIRSD